MASLEQRGRTYRVIFRHEGRKFSRSLQTVDERDAKASLARLEDNLRRVSIGTLTIPEGADIATFLLSDGTKVAKRDRSSIVTLERLMEAFLGSLPEGSLESSTIEGMMIHQRHLQRVMGSGFRIHTLRLDDLQAYVDHRSRARGQRGRTVQPATIKKELRTLTTAWNWAIEVGILQTPLPKRRIRYPKTTAKLRFQTWDEIALRIERGGLTGSQQLDLWDCLFLTNSQIAEFLEHVRCNATLPFVYPMFNFAAHTGARRSELLRSRLDDLDLYTRTVTIREKKRVPGQITTRSVPMSPQLHAALTDWLSIHPGGEYTFCDDERPLTRNQAVCTFQAAIAGSRWRHVRGWHVFRHSFCSNCAAAGIDQRLINGWVGHQTEEMVRRYRHLIPDQQQAAIARVFG